MFLVNVASMNILPRVVDTELMSFQIELEFHKVYK
jgi:hypothetical protein